MNTASWLMPLSGGLLIGLAASLLLLLNGRIAGISNIVAGVRLFRPGDMSWRWCFILGLLAGGLTLTALLPGRFGQPSASLGTLAFAGLLVGFGARVGNGCTSGHGVCGLSRRSFRSLVATLVFMGTAMVTVYLSQHVFGGRRG